MTGDLFELSDGSMLLSTVDSAEFSRVPQPADGTLSTIDVAAEVSTYLADVVGAGITFELLKIGAMRLVDRFHLRPSKATASSVRDDVLSFLTESGYLQITFSQIEHVPGEGWTTSGRADQADFRTMCDEDGLLVHIRVG
jgi:hypothetical protein